MERVYEDKLLNFEHLKTNICQNKTEIPHYIDQKVVENYLKWIKACENSQDGFLNDMDWNAKVSTL